MKIRLGQENVSEVIRLSRERRREIMEMCLGQEGVSEIIRLSREGRRGLRMGRRRWKGRREDVIRRGRQGVIDFEDLGKIENV